MLSRFFNRYDLTTLAPDVDLAVIGDVHGCATLLERALRTVGDRQIICVGDYIDRGPASRDVLEMLSARPGVVCLGGNHEDMLIAFLDDPNGVGARWLRHGGTETLMSYGIRMAPDDDTAQSRIDLRDAITAAMGQPLIQWLRSRPDQFVSGNVAVVHAAADPALPMDQQDRKTLRWGNRRLSNTPRKDGIWVVHGHVVVPEPRVNKLKISIDTGAYATGRLTLAKLTSGDASFEVFTDA